MKCNFCRNEVPEGSKFCPTCGAPVEEKPQAEETQEQAETPGASAEEPQDQTQYQYGAPAEDQTQYQYSAPDQDQTQYQYGAPNQDQTQYQYGAPNQDQTSYQYGAPAEDQTQYQYSAPNQDQTQYQYGAPNQDQTQYQYGAPNQDQTQYQYGAPGQDQTQYQYGAPNQNQQYQYGSANPGQNNYGQNNYGQNNYGQPQKQISGTPYMVFAILTTLLCCLPLGIAAIVFASKINSLQRIGDYEGAQNAAKKAKICCIISAIIGLIANIVVIAMVVMGEDESTIADSNLPVIEDIMEDDDEDVVAKKPAAPAVQSGDLGAAWDTFTVQLNDTVLTFPCAIADLQSAGLSLDTDDTPENYMVNAGEYELAYFGDDKGNEFLVYVLNNTNEAKTLVECMVGGVSVDDYFLEEGSLTVIFPGGVQIGTDKDTVLAAYGEADDVYEGDSLHMYTWYSDESYYKSCEIDFDADTGLVSGMIMQNFE